MSSLIVPTQSRSMERLSRPTETHLKSSRANPSSTTAAKIYRANKNDLLTVTTQLSIMCRSGVDLAGALNSVVRDCRQPKLKEILAEVSQQVNSGVQASVALGKHSATFGPAYIASMAAAEASGTLVDVLQRLCDQLKNEIRMQQVLRSIFTYPIVLFVVASLVMNALVFFVLPQFAMVFKNLGRPAPPMTQFLLVGASLLRSQSHWLLAAVSLVGYGTYRFAASSTGRRYRDRAVFQIPILRDAMRSLLSGRVFRLMGDLLESSVPLVEALRLAQSTVNNILLKEMLEAVERDVLNGQGIGREFSATDLIPPGAAQMVVTAERTGRLGNVLRLIGEHYEEQGEQQLKQTARVVEPAIIVLMGLAVGAVVMAVMLPLLDVSTVS